MSTSDSESNNDAGWTLVSRHTRNKRNLQPCFGTPSLSRPLAIPSTAISVEEITKYYKKAVEAWTQDASYKKFVSVFQNNMQREPVNVKKAICLGIGTVSRSTSVVTAAMTCTTQLEAFKTMVRVIQIALKHRYTAKGSKTDNCQGNGLEEPPITIKKYLQEPRLTSAECQFYQGNDIEVVDDPKGFDLIDDATLLYAPHLDFDVYLKALMKGPVIVVGNEVSDMMMQHKPVVDLVTRLPVGAKSRVLEIMRGSVKVPEFRHTIDGSIYWNIKWPHLDK